MALIMRNNGQKRDDGDKRKQLYTWVGCGLVVVLTLFSVIPNLGSDNKPDYGKFSSTRMQDLAALPFGTDAEAGNFLRNNPDYQEMSNSDLWGLFSEEERKERQALDAANGNPPPPDLEYKDIADQKKKIEEAQEINKKRVEKRKKAVKDYNDRKQKVKNANNNGGKTLQGGTRAGQGGASSGVTGSTWAYQKKDINGMPAAHTATAKDYAFANKMGRSTGFAQAALESAKGANAADADAAAAGAINAFQKEISAEELKKDEEELGLDEVPADIDEDFRDDLYKDLNDDVNDQNGDGDDDGDPDPKDYDIGENCIDTNGEVSWKCMGMKALQSGLDLVTDYLSWGLQGGWKEGRQQRKMFNKCKEANYTGSACDTFEKFYGYRPKDKKKKEH